MDSSCFSLQLSQSVHVSGVVSSGSSLTCWAFVFSCRVEAEARDDNEEPDGHGSTDPRPGAAEVAGGPGSVRTSLHGKVCT